MAPLNQIQRQTTQYFRNKQQMDYNSIMNNPVARPIFEQWIKSNPQAKQAYEQWKLTQTGTPTPATTSPATPVTPAAKPMESERVTPALLRMFDGDEEEASGFLESLNDHELSIIEQHRDNPRVIERLKLRVRDDVENTAKDLAIDD